MNGGCRLIGGLVLTSATVMFPLVAGRAGAVASWVLWIVGLGLSLGGWFGIVGRVCFPRCTCEVKNSEVPHG